jgi:YidC/Oxa1 family membrane protein insertase
MKPFYEAIAWLVVHIHSGLTHVFGSHSAWAWALSIVFLTIAMRLVLFPLFVKQIKNQRAMQVLQPKMKELQAKYKNDKEKLNQEMMALWREHGANPLAGCLPLVLQIPVFIALFRVLNSLKPGCGTPSSCYTDPTYHIQFSHHYGISAKLVASAATSKVLGVPIFAAFNTSQQTLSQIGAHSSTVKIVTAVMIVLMGASTFITQRQLMARNATQSTGSNQFAQQQKILLYVLPLTFAIFGYRFPLGVLLYWLTTNLWSMGQQRIVIRRMETGTATAGVAGRPAPTVPAPGAKPVRPTTPAPAPDAGVDGGANGSSPGTAPSAGNGAKPPPNASRPGGNRRPSGRNRRRRGGRR